MSEDASQAAATAGGGSDSATVVHSSGGGGNAALNPVFRTAPAPDTAGKPAGRQGTAQDRTGAQGDDGRSPEELLAEATQDGDGTEDPLAKAQAEIAKWKQQARENEKRAKANADKAKNYDAYEESQKTEQQRLADQLAAAQREAQDAREDRFRLLAAAQYDLPPSLIGHLGGGSEDEITERAEAFAQAINERAEVIAAAQAQAAAQQQPRNGGGFRPVESLRPGALPASDNKPADANAWMRQALGRR
jgi:hypothetical protein